MCLYFTVINGIGGYAVSMTVNGYVSTHIRLSESLLLTQEGSDSVLTNPIEHRVGGLLLQPFHTLLLLADREVVKQGLISLGAGNIGLNNVNSNSNLDILTLMLHHPPTSTFYDLAMKIYTNKTIDEEEEEEEEEKKECILLLLHEVSVIM